MLAGGHRRDRVGARGALNAVIVGVGESRIGRVPGFGALRLMVEAMDAALLSIGLEQEAINGLITLPVLTEN